MTFCKCCLNSIWGSSIWRLFFDKAIIWILFTVIVSQYFQDLETIFILSCTRESDVGAKIVTSHRRPNILDRARINKWVFMLLGNNSSKRNYFNCMLIFLYFIRVLYSIILASMYSMFLTGSNFMPWNSRYGFNFKVTIPAEEKVQKHVYTLI